MRLPFNNNTQINTYQPEAFISGIILAQDNRDMPYILSNYIRTVHYIDSPTVLNYCIDNPLLKNDGVITEKLTVIPMKCVPNIVPSAIAVNSLNNGGYVFGTFNDGCIPGKAQYNNHYFIHDYLLYGYENESFVSSAYLADGHHREFRIAFDDYNRAMLTQEPDMYMHLLYYNREKQPGFNEEQVIAAIQDYIASRPIADDGAVYGAKGIKLFADETEKRGGYIDIRSLCFLKEHKRLMRLRLSYMKEKCGLKLPDAVISQYEAMETRLQTAVMLGLKSKVAPSDALSARIAATVRSSAIQDEGVLQKLLQQYN